jgi:phage terminase large subunit-like protein
MDLLNLQSDPAAFRDALLIDTSAGPKPYRDCIQGNDWQADDFAALDPGWRRAVVGEAAEPAKQRAWLERPRGHSKSNDLGIMASWALFASRRRLSLIGCAADLEQARILRDAIGRLVFCNPWLGRLIEVQNYRVVNTRTESTLDIISSDAKSAYGLTPDGVICDEVVHWKNGDLWEAMLSSAAKRSTCMFVVISNAGMKDDDWVWRIREAVRVDPNWHFSRLEKPTASWIGPKQLEEQQRLLPSIAFRRLWLNEWTSGGGDFLTAEQIARAFVPGLTPQTAAIPGYEYVGGLDLGVVRDASALCILGIRRGADGHGMIRLAFTRVWRPVKGQKVDLQAIEDAIYDAHGRFNLKALNYDPWEARHMASRLQAGRVGVFQSQLGRLHSTSKVPMVEVTATPKNLQTMATCLLEAFNDVRLELYDDADLRRDLTRFRVEEREYGFRIVSPKDEYGHGDLGMAFALAMIAATERAAKRVMTAGVLSDRPMADTAGKSRSQIQLERELEQTRRNNERREREHREHLGWSHRDETIEAFRSGKFNILPHE